MPKQRVPKERRWYVIHTYSGYEDAVAKNLKQRVESLGMEDKIFNILVPKEKKIKIKDGKRKVVEEKIYPGYILVEMIVTDDSWYVVRNTPSLAYESTIECKNKIQIQSEAYKIPKKI